MTRELLYHRESFLNIQATIEHLLQMNIVPICNENDSVSIAEIGPVFGDNDNLSAHIASKLDADLLVLLTDIDALYTADPKKDKNAQAVRLVKKITPDLLKTASGSGSESGTGGMRTKLEAVQTAARAGTHVVIADGSQPDILLRMIKDEEVGTLFLSGPRLKSRHRWILNSAPKGSITVDQGAERALCDGKSLLPKGVTAVKGSFHSGDVIAINDRFHAISRLDSSQIQKIMGVHSKEAAKILGCDTDVVAQAEDIVIKKPIEDEG